MKSPATRMDSSPARLAVYVAWAVIVGCSVSLQLCNSVILDSRDGTGSPYHGFYISSVAVFLGGLFLLPQAASSTQNYQSPSKWWHVLGGLCSLPLFVGIPAGQAFGTSATLLMQLTGVLSVSLLLDITRGDMNIADTRRWLAFASVLVGASLEFCVSTAGSISSELTLGSTLLMVLVFLGGGCITLQAKFNACLVQDLGCAARATVVGAVVFASVALPVHALLWAGMGIPPL